jgi:putative redox protein
MDMVISFPGNKKVDAAFKGFTIKTDQPTMAGGDNSAPAPFDLFLASIGTCAGIYVASFCQQRGIATDNIRIVQRMLRNAEQQRIETIELEIQLPADFPEQYQQAIIRSAELCAVKKHLETPPVFRITTNKNA